VVTSKARAHPLDGTNQQPIRPSMPAQWGLSPIPTCILTSYSPGDDQPCRDPDITDYHDAPPVGS
jgi:hypothetical protein